MGSVTYSPPPGETQNTEMRGLRFEAGKAVNINDPLMLRKLSGNSHFQVEMSDEEREAAENEIQQRSSGTVQVTATATAHRPYYSSTGAAVTDDQDAIVGSGTGQTIPPTTAVAAGGGLNTSTLGDLPTPDQVYEKYGTDNPTDSMIPGDPIPPSNVNEGVMQVQADRNQRAEQQQQAAPKRGPGRPPKAKPEPQQESGPTFE